MNALVGEELLATQEVREDDQRGRHTTTHRELILLPSGGVVLDTPGIRELQLWDADLEQTFGDVEEIARQLPLQRLRPRPGARLRDPRGARRRVARRRALAELREAAARARGDRGAPQPPTATGTRPRVQDSRTREQAEEETLSPPRVREDAVEFVAARPRAPLSRGRARAGGRRGRASGRRSNGATARGGSTFPRPDVDRLEYLLALDGSFRPDPANPLRAPRPVRRQVGRRVARVRAAGLARLDRRRGPGRGDRDPLPPPRRARARAALRDAGPARLRTRRCSSRTTAPSTPSTRRSRASSTR